jgi:hypothetical protein
MQCVLLFESYVNCNFACQTTNLDHNKKQGTCAVSSQEKRCTTTCVQQHVQYIWPADLNHNKEKEHVQPILRKTFALEDGMTYVPSSLKVWKRVMFSMGESRDVFNLLMDSGFRSQTDSHILGIDSVLDIFWPSGSFSGSVGISCIMPMTWSMVPRRRGVFRCSSYTHGFIWSLPSSTVVDIMSGLKKWRCTKHCLLVSDIMSGLKSLSHKVDIEVVDATLLSFVRYTIVNRSRRICRKGKGLVEKKTHDNVHARSTNMNMGWVLVWILHCCQIHYSQ